MKIKTAFIWTVMFCALVAQAQEAPKDGNWESDPLDVLESPEKTQPAEPAVPKFEEIPSSGTPSTTTPEAPEAPEVPPATTVDVPLPEIEKSLEEAPKADIPAEPTPSPDPIPAKAPTPTPEPIHSNAVGSDPDYAKEARFHRIYKKYNEQPTSEEAWEKARGSGEAKVYQIQKGDTLFGVSKTFFADPFYWPKVWSLNHTQILNPHEIKPGMNVNFFPGSMEEAPTLELASTEKKGSVEAGKDAPAPPVKEAEVVIPEPKKKRTPLLKTIPGSLPLYRMGRIPQKNSEIFMEVSKASLTALPENLSYYLTDEPINGSGIVTATEMNTKSAGEFQYIYVRLDGGAKEKEYFAQKNVGPVNDPAQKGRKGQMVEVQGEIEILEPVNQEKNIYRAIVKKTIQPLEVGAVLTPGKMPLFSPKIDEVTSGVGAKIMGGQFDRKRTLFGFQNIVFLDKGADHGLYDGQALPIFADINLRNKKTEAIINDRMIGVVKIIKVTKNFATAYIAKSLDDILIGDYVGKNTTQAFNETAREADSEAAPVIENQPSNTDEFEKDFDETPAPEKSGEPGSGTDDSELEL